ncbi:MAG: hypothetical protein IT381_32120 [Deltaproteobacteria bacterium]|nr:hypothetical protein [Deltaproteobacteria bacterium]
MFQAFLALLFTAGSAFFVEREDLACPDDAAMQALIAHRLGRDAWAAKSGSVVSVRFTRESGPAFAARIHVRTDDGHGIGEKILRGDDCGDLGAAASLAISLVLADLAEDAAAAPLTENAPRYVGRERDAPMATVPARLDATPATPSRLSSVALEGGPAFEAFSLPAAAFGAELGLTLQARWFSFSARGRVLAPLVYASGTARVTSVVAGALVEGCGHASIVAICAIFNAAALRVSVAGLSEPRDLTTPWLATGLRVGVRLAMGGGVALRPYATLVVPVLAPALLIDGRAVWTAPPVAASFGIDAAYGWALQ